MNMFVDVPNVYLCSECVDFRKSINGLAGLVEAELELSVLSGALFVFCNKGKDKLKLLYWDNTGFALWYKRLDKDKFKWPKRLNAQTMTLTLNMRVLIRSSCDHIHLYYKAILLG